jgi:hypothetical protein
VVHVRFYSTPVDINKEGILFAEKSNLVPPWIEREHLKPSYEHYAAVLLGAMSDYDQFLDGNKVPYSEETNIIPWSDLYEYATKMVEHVLKDLTRSIEDHGS